MSAPPTLPDRHRLAQAFRTPGPFPLERLQHHLADATVTLPNFHPFTLTTALQPILLHCTGETHLLLSAGQTLHHQFVFSSPDQFPCMLSRPFWTDLDTLHLCHVQDGRLDTYARLTRPHTCVQLTHGLTPPQPDDPVIAFPGTLDGLRLLIRYLQQLEARLLTEPHNRLLDPQVFADLLIAQYGGQRLPTLPAPAQLRLHDTWERPWTHDALPGGMIRTLPQALHAQGWAARSQGLAQRLLAHLPPTPIRPTLALTLAQDTPEAWACQLDWDDRLWHIQTLFPHPHRPQNIPFRPASPPAVAVRFDATPTTGTMPL